MNLLHRASRPLAVCLFALATACAPSRDLDELAQQVRTRIDSSGAETVGFYFADLDTGDSLLVSPDARVHAASTMKVPVMIQLFRDAEGGSLDLDDSLPITKTFRSIVDGSPYDLAAPDDSDSTLYNRVGEPESIRFLMERMITVSSNLATNMLIELVGAERAQATMRELGADSIAVLRGVEDIKAYEAGLSNTTTARDLGVIFRAIADGRAASPVSCDSMVAILSRQEFNEGIPAGLPASATVAHKTGSITRIRHDGGVVYLDNGARYVLVVLVRGLDDHDAADRLIADLSRIVYEFVTS